MTSHQKIIETATSLEKFLNRSVIFVQGIDQNASKSEVLQVLNQVLKQPQQGRIDILTTPDGRNRGTAFLNFHNKDDAVAALDRWRFALELRGRPLKVQYSSDREFKDVVQGPLVSRFKVLIRNLPEELGPQELFDKYSAYGEIIQIHTSQDHYGQHFAIIQYLEVAAVHQAIRHTNKERVHNHILMVEPYRPNATYGPIPRSANTSAGSAAAAAANGPASASAASSSTPPGSNRIIGGTIGAHQGMTYAALQQQQERELAEQEQLLYNYAAGGSSGGGGRASGDGGGSNTAATGGGAAGTEAAAAAQLTGGSGGGGGVFPVPSFYETMPASPIRTGGAAAGSLQGLLATALSRVHLLDELLCCPITQEPMLDPVVAADGNTYERMAIEAWLANHDTSPLTNEVLPHKTLLPNNLIRKAAEELKGTGHGMGDQSAASAAATTAADITMVAAAAVAPQTATTAAVEVATTATLEVAQEPAVAAVQESTASAVRLAIPIPVPTPAAAAAPQHQELHPQVQEQQAETQGTGYITQSSQAQQPQQPLMFGMFRHHQAASQQQQQPQPPQQYQVHAAPMMAHLHHIQPQQQHQQQATPQVVFAQPYQYQAQGTTFYAYRPMGM